jgi:hypothetical protein
MSWANARAILGLPASAVPLHDIVREVVPFPSVMVTAIALAAILRDRGMGLPRLMGYKEWRVTGHLRGGRRRGWDWDSTVQSS